MPPSPHTQPLDFLVVCDTGRPSAQMCSECRAQLATTRSTVMRVDRGGMLVSERERDASDTRAALVTASNSRASTVTASDV